MAEERIIDDDKDKNYRFRINADGKEEIVTDGDAEGDGVQVEEAELSFEHAPDIDEEYAYGGEDPSYETREEQEAVYKLLEKARSDASEDKYSTALEYIIQAKDIAPEDGAVAALELLVYTRNLTEFSPNILDDAVDAAKRVASFSSEEDKKTLAAAGAERIDSMIGELKSQADELNERNEKGKAERAVRFASDNIKSIIICLALFVPFVVCCALAIYFSTIMYIDTSGTFIWVTIVFGVLAALFFIALLFGLRRFSTTWRRVRMNRDNSRTQVGRDYEAAKSRMEALKVIYNAITN